MIGPQHLEQVTEEASKAFWQEVERQLPEISAGNLDVGTVISLQWHMRESIYRWIQNNLAFKETAQSNGKHKS